LNLNRYERSIVAIDIDISDSRKNITRLNLVGWRSSINIGYLSPQLLYIAPLGSMPLEMGDRYLY